MVAWFIPLLIGLALSIVAYLLMPKPKQPQPEATKDMEAPTVDSGNPIPVVFGTLTLKALNIIWYGDKNKWDYKVRG